MSGIEEEKKFSFIQYLILGAMLYGAHILISNWFLNNNVSSCKNPTSNRDISVCSCIKSKARTSFVVEQAFLGGGQSELEGIMRRCKGI